MKTELFSKGEFELARSSCSKLVFTSHRIIQQDKEGNLVSSIELHQIQNISRTFKRSIGLGLVTAILCGATLGFGILYGFHLFTISSAILVLPAAFLFRRYQKENICILTTDGNQINVVSNCLKEDSQKLVNAIESARFQQFNQKYKSSKEPKKDTKVVKITA
ncbi:MAG: hypothetical protein JXR19_10980 [Bacteroidia bacterium]